MDGLKIYLWDDNDHLVSDFDSFTRAVEFIDGFSDPNFTIEVRDDHFGTIIKRDQINKVSSGIL